MILHPLTAYHFIVEWGGARINFMEVTGLEITSDVIEYREGNEPSQAARKMPGLRKYTNITLKRGIIKGDNDFFNWINTISLNQVERRDVSVRLLNEAHEPLMIWNVRNCFPVKLTGPDLKANASEVAIEQLELAHEGFTIEVM